MDHPPRLVALALAFATTAAAAAPNPATPTRATPAQELTRIATVDTADHGKVALLCNRPRAARGGALRCSVKRLSDGRTVAATTRQIAAKGDAAATWEVSAPWIESIEVGARRNGLVFKGPFAPGATVRFVPLDGALARAVSTDRHGGFTDPVSLTAPTWAEAEGVYYDEAAGRLAGGTIRLEALQGAGGSPDVTAATHLRARRVLVLLDEMPLASADQQARAELRHALAAPESGFDVWLGTALTTAAPTPEALQRLLDEWAADLSDGELSPATRRRFARAIAEMDIDRARNDLRAWHSR